MNNCQTSNVNCFAVNHVPFVGGQPHKKNISPHCKTKYGENVSCADQLCSVQPVTNVHIGSS